MIKHIKPLPISEEMLGAYLEDNLVQNDAQYVEQMLQNNDELSAFVEELSLSDDLTSNYQVEELPNFEENFSLPEISTEIRTYLEPHVLPFGFEPSFADVAACACVPNMTDNSDIYDMIFEDKTLNSEFDDSNYHIDNYNEDSNVIDNDNIDYL